MGRGSVADLPPNGYTKRLNITGQLSLDRLRVAKDGPPSGRCTLRTRAGSRVVPPVRSHRAPEERGRRRPLGPLGAGGARHFIKGWLSADSDEKKEEKKKNE